ncbi:MAG: PKD domain-containing protein [Methylicorpusculum sp.]|uniref:PKD domain-containing protein n=1 Tax=Methylicorpusculum sp. TaxID=2713644 RepID=UPI00271ACA43|nr:PKD domain-containing protein [Methylicorpusculum sp.]MDO8941190.1 PKD domain-containing protein [Methylicorpusculum sp.]MDP2203916.1 PKD domain-containing protein [Methylicorpusculum sp.]
MSCTNSPMLRTLTSALLTASLLAVIPSVQAKNTYLKTWQDTYIGSTSDNASCNLCHGTSNSNLNAYGKDLCTAFSGSVPAEISSFLRSIEDSDSDSDEGQSSNLNEIEANAQPGWTLGPVNQIYAADVKTCSPIGSPISVPGNVPLPYDPPVDGMPVAIPGGPYTGNVNVPITFDGSGSYDSDDTNEIASYEWDFGDGTTGAGEVVQHTYTVPGTYIVNLTVTDDEGFTNTNSTIATISGNAVLDLDISAFKVTKSQSIGKPVSIQLSVENPGTVLGQALAAVVGMQDGIEVYRWSLNVYDYNGKGTTSFTFPSYKPTAKGTINWTVTIADVDPDIDQATAITEVK